MKKAKVTNEEIVLRYTADTRQLNREIKTTIQLAEKLEKALARIYKSKLAVKVV